jgi:hypothetical protein
LNESDFTHWLVLPEGTKHVVFGDLPHLMAKALWPDDEDPERTNWSYGGARVNLKDELPKAVQAGQLAIKDPLTFGPHTFPHGAALESAVVLVPDLRDFLARRGVGVRIAKPPSAQFFPVEGVAREAAVHRHPIPEDADADGRVLAEAWQGWAIAALLIQLNGYVHDQKVSVFFRGSPLSGQREAFDVPKDEWQVDEAGRSVLLALFIEDPVLVLPTFHVPPRPLQTPPALLLLPAEARVRLQWTWQRLSESVGSAADAVEMFTDVIARQAEGWLRIDEAAQLLKEAGRGAAANWRDKFLAAAQSGGLPTHEPGTYDRVNYEPLSSSQQPRRARDFYELVHADDLNTWLAANEPRLPYRFPAMSANPLPAVEPALLSPLSNGLWLIAEAAASLARQQQLSVEGRRSLSKRMGDCAQLPSDALLHLRTRHLETALPLPADEATGLAMGVFPSDINDWLAACNAGYRWNVSQVDEDEQGNDVGAEAEAPQAAAPTASLTTDEVCEAFDKVGMTSQEWRTTITKNLPDWLTACRTMVGKTGANPVQAKWDPLKLAIALVTGLSRKAGAVPVAKLDAAFKRQPLRKFAQDWEALRADNPAWGD